MLNAWAPTPRRAAYMILIVLYCSCMWDEKPCNMHRVYQELTDYGVCYTFNTARYGDATHAVSRTGRSQP